MEGNEYASIDEVKSQMKPAALPLAQPDPDNGAAAASSPASRPLSEQPPPLPPRPPPNKPQDRTTPLVARPKAGSFRFGREQLSATLAVLGVDKLAVAKL